MKKLNIASVKLQPRYFSIFLSIVFISCSKSDYFPSPNQAQANQPGAHSLLPTAATATVTRQPAHTVIVILENHSYSEIVSSAEAPYINSLLKDGHTAYFTQSYGVTHPSQPNYIALFSGSTHGVFTDDVPIDTPFTTANLGAELIHAGFSFAGYSEDLPYAGYTGATYNAYARKHSPWVNWQGTGKNGIPASDNLPFTNFPADFNQLPAVSFVIPNLNNDMHDGTIAAGDTWLKNNLSSYIEWAKANNSLFILSFDENDYSLDSRILSFFTGANIKGGSYSQRINHLNVLHTIENLYGLPHAAASRLVRGIDGIWLQ